MVDKIASIAELQPDLLEAMYRCVASEKTNYNSSDSEQEKSTENDNTSLSNTKKKTKKNFSYLDPCKVFQYPKKCYICSKYFPTVKLMYIHQFIHTDLRIPYRCTICLEGYMTEEDYINHIETHNDFMKCPECGKQMASEKYLADHIRVHTGQLYGACSLCGHGFFYKGRYGKHLAACQSRRRVQKLSTLTIT